MTAPLPDLAGIGDLLRSGVGVVASARAFGREVPSARGRAPAHAVGALGAKAAADPGGPILVLGAPRSGTTWLGKIFDSHPDVLYRHEPDAVQEDAGLPWICPPEISADLRRMAAAYLDRMAGTATLKTAAIPPLFAKHYRDGLRRAARGGLIAALRGLAAAGLAPRRTVDRLRIPDLLGPGAAPVRTVVKSVSAHGRARAFAEAAPNARIVVILRDPWGYVASVMRGVAQGRLPAEAPLDWIPGSPSGRRHGLTAALLAAMPPVERLTWNWIAINEQLLDDLAGRANVLHVRYDELCEQPMPQARRIFAFAGLSWHRQTERFLARSTSFRGTARYYAVFRDATEAPHRWRQELPPEDQRRVAEILRRSALAAFCPALEA